MGWRSLADEHSLRFAVPVWLAVTQLLGESRKISSFSIDGIFLVVCIESGMCMVILAKCARDAP